MVPLEGPPDSTAIEAVQEALHGARQPLNVASLQMSLAQALLGRRGESSDLEDPIRESIAALRDLSRALEVVDARLTDLLSASR